jgi:hypothetical protein
MLEIFLWVSTVAFWLLIFSAVRRTIKKYREEKGTNEKVRTKETSVAVLKRKGKTVKSITN